MEHYLQSLEVRYFLIEEPTSYLYRLLRQADDEKVSEIIVYCSPEVLQNKALIDRLEKAANVNL
jgi:hypothetical protein